MNVLLIFYGCISRRKHIASLKKLDGDWIVKDKVYKLMAVFYNVLSKNRLSLWRDTEQMQKTIRDVGMRYKKVWLQVYIVILDMPRSFCFCDRYRKYTGTWTIQSRERERASSSGFCANSFLRPVQKGYRTYISPRAAVTTVEQLLPPIARKNTEKLRVQILTTMNRKQCTSVHYFVYFSLILNFEYGWFEIIN